MSFDLFSYDFDYAFEKLVDAVRGTGPEGLGRLALEQAQRAILELQVALKLRDVSSDNATALNAQIEKLTYPIDHLHRYLDAQDSDVVSQEMAEIVAFYIRAQFEQLVQTVHGLDGDG